MGKTLIKGNKMLAEALGVSPVTVWKWNKEGILEPATLSRFRRTIIYDLDKVLMCLNHRTPRYAR